MQVIGHSVGITMALLPAKPEPFLEPPLSAGLGVAPLVSVQEADLSVMQGMLCKSGYTVDECLEVEATVLGLGAEVVTVAC